MDGGTESGGYVSSIHIDPRSSTPPYEQVRAHLARHIGDGTLPVGAKLPTVRAFAADLGLAVNTVARVYRELEEAGLITTRGRSGSFVAAGGIPSRERALRAAREYAELASTLGLTPDEALQIVAAAITAI